MAPASYTHATITVDRGQHPLRIDKLLADHLPNKTRSQVQKVIRSGGVLVNGAVIKPNYLARPCDQVTIVADHPPRDKTIVPEAIPLDIVYEDQVLLIVNKPAAMVVHPAHQHWSGTLVHALAHHCADLPIGNNNEGRPGLVHRIDKGTSGLLVIAKTSDSLQALAKQFYEHTIERKYIVLVWGQLLEEQGTICVPIGRSKKDRRVMVAYSEGSQGKSATTHYQVLKRLLHVTLVSCQLETGRTHQIRAHMRHLGHPLFGDPRYGGDQIVEGPSFAKYKTFVHNCFAQLPHQALHAQSIGFIHPTTKERVSFEAPLPPNLAQVISKWERYTQAQS